MPRPGQLHPAGSQLIQATGSFPAGPLFRAGAPGATASLELLPCLGLPLSEFRPHIQALANPPLFAAGFTSNKRSRQGPGSQDFCLQTQAIDRGLTRQPGRVGGLLRGFCRAQLPPAQTLPEAAEDAPHVASFRRPLSVPFPGASLIPPHLTA